MSRSDKIARIRKCLALSKSANEHEAAAALAMAGKLMAEMGVGEEEAAFLDIEERSARGSRCKRPSAWETVLASTVCRALHCRRYIDALGDWQFVGRGPAAEIAAYAFKVLYRRLKAARAAYLRSALRRCRPARRRVRANAFCEGWARAVFNKIAAIAPEISDAMIERYLAERHPGLTSVLPRFAKLRGADGDFFNGVVGGHRVELHRGMTGDHSSRLLAHG